MILYTISPKREKCNLIIKNNLIICIIGVCHVSKHVQYTKIVLSLNVLHCSSLVLIVFKKMIFILNRNELVCTRVLDLFQGNLY